MMAPCNSTQANFSNTVARRLRFDSTDDHEGDAFTGTHFGEISEIFWMQDTF